MIRLNATSYAKVFWNKSSLSTHLCIPCGAVRDWLEREAVADNLSKFNRNEHCFWTGGPVSASKHGQHSWVAPYRSRPLQPLPYKAVLWACHSLASLWSSTICQLLVVTRHVQDKGALLAGPFLLSVRVGIRVCECEEGKNALGMRKGPLVIFHSSQDLRWGTWHLQIPWDILEGLEKLAYILLLEWDQKMFLKHVIETNISYMIWDS